MSSSHNDVRQFMVSELKKDLVGPGKPDEELTDRPTIHYMTGILYPRETEMEKEQDDDSNQAALDDDEIDTGTLIAASTNPSSIGLTFTVRKSEKIQINVQTAIYCPLEDKSTGRDIWQRKGLEISPVQVVVDQPGIERKELHPGLELLIRTKFRDAYGIVTLSLTNTFSFAGRAETPDEYCFFQPEIAVTSTEEGIPVFLTRYRHKAGFEDPDRAMNDLLYRHAPEFAVGHGCAVEWDAEEGKPAKSLRTAIVPEFEIQQLSPDAEHTFKAQEMLFLSQAGTKELVSGLRELTAGYRDWISDQKRLIGGLSDNHKAVALQNLDRCQRVVERAESGIVMIGEDAAVREAFQLSNRGMLMQRARITWLKMAVDARPPVPELSSDHRWRPFQIFFILLCMSSIADPSTEARSAVDLLWFPTGGGKTEAYLGLTAFTIFLRRLRASNIDEVAGVTVLMRYTLRLLTIQQFQRAASLLLSCESIRRSMPDRLGEEPISLGLWVGGAATPNSLKEAAGKLRELLEGERVLEGNPYQIHSCPWCGAKMTPRDYRIGVTMLIQCPDKVCEFSGGLPLYVVDEDIYKRMPSLLIGTVDKFARLPWLASSSALFGRGEKRYLPPELIIQDELHLITGPLGTLVGLYETAIDALCQRNGIPPKIIASTATIRRAAEQCLGLFDRSLSQFPPPGMDARDSFFARQVPSEEKPGRLYIGVHAPGKSMKTTLLRVYALLLQKIYEHQSEPERRDPYWTLIGYFNSMRELGGAVRLVDDDVRERMRVLSKRAQEDQKQRYLNSVRELNSRIGSDEIPEILDQMSREMGDPAALDVLLATNMISVGVDIDRLGLMVVNGQPKMSSEYIQATSRIGRMFPGLVVTLYNWTRPRDRSHYERFVGYHSAIYSHVEPTSVTPFASRGRDRGLHGVFITLVRHLDPEMTPENAAARFTPESAAVKRVIEIILQRVAQIDPAETGDVRQELESICYRWQELSGQEMLIYGQSLANPGLPHLMEPAESGRQPDSLVFPTLNSLRDVEGESGLFILKRGS